MAENLVFRPRTQYLESADPLNNYIFFFAVRLSHSQGR